MKLPENIELLRSCVLMAITPLRNAAENKSTARKDLLITAQGANTAKELP
jgi:hypothetical protein